MALPFEVSTSFLKVTDKGPDRILGDLEGTDDFSMLLGRRTLENVPYRVHRPHGSELVDAKIQQAVASRVTSEIIGKDGFPLALGGEHTVTLGPLRSALALGEVGVVQIDAHADLRDTLDGDPLSHGCVMRRAHEMGCPILGIGIRSMSEGESQYVAEKSIVHVDPDEANRRTGWYKQLEELPEMIDLTIDLDGFDPADVSAVGTAEPGGLKWNPVCDFLHHLFGAKDVVAADIVELMPTQHDQASTRLASRLAQLILGLRFSHIH